MDRRCSVNFKNLDLSLKKYSLITETQTSHASNPQVRVINYNDYDKYIKAKGLSDDSGREGQRGSRKLGFMLALKTMNH